MTHILPISLLLLFLLFRLSPHDHKMGAAPLGTTVFTGRKEQVRKAQRNNSAQSIILKLSLNISR